MKFGEILLFRRRLFRVWTLALVAALCACMESPIIKALSKEASSDDSSAWLVPAAALVVQTSSGTDLNCNPGLSGTLTYTCSQSGQLDICQADLSKIYCGSQNRSTVDPQNLTEAEGLYLPTVRDDSHPVYDVHSGRMFFFSKRDHFSFFSLYSMALDGSDVRRFGADYVVPDNLVTRSDYLYTKCYHDMMYSPGTGLCRYDDVSESRSLLLADTSPIRLSSIDAGTGNRIYFFRTGESYLRYWDSQSENLISLTSYDSINRLQLAPGGTVFMQRQLSTNQIYSALPPGSVSQLTFPQEPTFHHSSMSLSPDGRYFTASTNYSPERGVWLYRADGSRIAQLSEGVGTVTLGWSAGDEHVILGGQSSVLRIIHTETLTVHEITLQGRAPVAGEGEIQWN